MLQSRDGWWDGEYTEFIRQILKRKFLALLNEGIQLPNDSFDDLFEYLDTYRAQRGYTHNYHQTNDTTMTAASDDIEQNGDYANEMEDQVNNLTQKKLVSLRDKGKRNQKPKAITLNDGLVSFPFFSFILSFSLCATIILQYIQRRIG